MIAVPTGKGMRAGIGWHHNLPAAGTCPSANPWGFAIKFRRARLATHKRTHFSAA